MSESHVGALSAPDEAGRRRALERAMVRIRWFGVVFGLFQVWQDSSMAVRPAPLVEGRAGVPATRLPEPEPVA